MSETKIDLQAFVENYTFVCKCGNTGITSIGTPNPRCIDCIDKDTRPKPEKQQ